MGAPWACTVGPLTPNSTLRDCVVAVLDIVPEMPERSHIFYAKEKVLIRGAGPGGGHMGGTGRAGARGLPAGGAHTRETETTLPYHFDADYGFCQNMTACNPADR